MKLTVEQAQDVLRALRAVEHPLALYEAHLRRVVAVTGRTVLEDVDQQLAAAVRAHEDLADAVYVVQDSLAGWAMRALERTGGQRALTQEGDCPF